MTNYYARSRRSRGAWLDGLLVNQSTEVTVATLDDLRDFDETVQNGTSQHALVAVDQPNPARGYTLLAIVKPEAIYSRLHVIPDQHDDVYRALFSQTRVQADILAAGIGAPAGQLPVRVDADTLAPYVAERIERFGAAYGIETNETSAATQAELAGHPSTGSPAAATAAHLETGQVTIPADQMPAMDHGPHTVVIHYGSNDIPAKTLTVKHGDTIDQPSDAAAPGMTFDYWGTSIPGQAEMPEFDWSKPITEDIEVYAVMNLAGEPLTDQEQADLDASGEQPSTIGEHDDESADTQEADNPQGEPEQPQADDSEPNTQDTTDEWACPLCPKTYKTEQGLEKHLDAKHAD